jgi:RNA-binding protein
MSENTSAPAPMLTTRQKQHLKGLAHHLRPLVQIGKESVSPGIVETVIAELLNHELIKVKIGNNSGLEKHATSRQVADLTDSVLIQLIGKIFVLYKPNPDKPKDKRILLPKS